MQDLACAIFLKSLAFKNIKNNVPMYLQLRAKPKKLLFLAILETRKKQPFLSQISKYAPHKIILVHFELVKKLVTPATLDVPERGFESAGLECILILLMAHF